MRPSSAFSSFKPSRSNADQSSASDEDAVEAATRGGAELRPLTVPPPLETLFNDVTNVPPPQPYTALHRHMTLPPPLPVQPVNYVADSALLQLEPAAAAPPLLAHRSVHEAELGGGGGGGVRVRPASATAASWGAGSSFDYTMMLLMGNELGGPRDSTRQQQQQQHLITKPLLRPSSAKESIYSDSLSFIQDDDAASEAPLSDAAYADLTDEDADVEGCTDNAADNYDDYVGFHERRYDAEEPWHRGAGSSSIAHPLFSRCVHRPPLDKAHFAECLLTHPPSLPPPLLPSPPSPHHFPRFCCLQLRSCDSGQGE
jgi:hypothetical protein